jgi:predicted kinase
MKNVIYVDERREKKMLIWVLVGMVSMMGLMTFFAITDRKKRNKSIFARLRDTYGLVPKKTKTELADIAAYWEQIEDSVSETDKIDAVTWDDLEMDKVFHRLNSTNSFMGEQILYAKLHCTPKDKNHLIEMEKEMSWARSHSQERERLQFSLGMVGKERENYYLPLFIANAQMQRIPRTWIFRLLQVTLGVLLLLTLITRNDYITLFLFINVAVNIAIYVTIKSKYEVYLGLLEGIVNTIRFNKKVIEGNDYPHEFVSDAIRKAMLELKGVTKAMTALILMKQREMNAPGEIFEFLCNYLIGMTFVDIIRYDKVMVTLDKKQKEFMQLYEFAGAIDSMISVSSFRESVRTYCTPKFTNNKELRMKQCYHPFIGEPVKNDLVMNRNIILTGSNASGKSTFIKAVALNLVLAQSIHTCLAKEALLPDAQIITSMSARDDIIGGESYYMKEIKYLKRIVLDNKDRITLCTIDEILRGTNTLERIAASEAVLHYLNRKNCLILVATHDLELAVRLEDSCDMYHFAETIIDGDVEFDYKIKVGICNSRNAIRMLALEQFPDEIIEEAMRRVDSEVVNL